MKFLNLIKFIFLISLMIFSTHGMASPKPLPEAQAFKLNVKIIDPNTIGAQWQLAKGYFLYKNHIRAKLKSTHNAMLGSILLPPGQFKKSPELGRYQVYFNQLHVAIPVLGLNSGNNTLTVAYQGCSADGFCYPPTQKHFVFTINPNDGVTTLTPLTIDNKITPPLSKAESLLSHASLPFILIGFFGFGLLLAFTPCVLPMIPVLSGIIVGHGHKVTTQKAFSLSLVYVLCMSLTYALVGFIIASIGQNVQIILQNPWSISVFSLLFVALSLSMFGFYDLKLPESLQSRLANLSRRQQGGAYAGAAIMGILSTLILSPCVTAPLVGALAYIANTGDKALGMLALFALGLGMGTPLLIIGTAFGKLLPKAGHWMNGVKTFFGVLLLGIAIYLMSRVIPSVITMLLSASLLILYGMYCGALSRVQEATGLERLIQGLGLMMVIWGSCILIGTSMGNSDPLAPLAHMQRKGYASTENKNPSLFIPVTSLPGINKQLAIANKIQKPVVLDFYADWCTECKMLDKTLFQNASVIQQLKAFNVLRIDLTQQNNFSKSIQQHFSVVAPPTFVFFDSKGNQLAGERIVGDITAQAFLSTLKRVIRHQRQAILNAPIHKPTILPSAKPKTPK